MPYLSMKILWINPFHVDLEGKKKKNNCNVSNFYRVLKCPAPFSERKKQMGKKRAKIQNPVKIAHKAVILFFLLGSKT